MVSLYKALNCSYTQQKSKNIYININPDTFSYRKELLEAIVASNNYIITSKPVPFNEYLIEVDRDD
jgi:hypothetical protein